MCHIIQWAWLCRAAKEFEQPLCFGLIHGAAMPPADHTGYYTYDSVHHLRSATTLRERTGIYLVIEEIYVISMLCILLTTHSALIWSRFTLLKKSRLCPLLLAYSLWLCILVVGKLTSCLFISLVGLKRMHYPAHSLILKMVRCPEARQVWQLFLPGNKQEQEHGCSGENEKQQA